MVECSFDPLINHSLVTAPLLIELMPMKECQGGKSRSGCCSTPIHSLDVVPTCDVY